MSGAAGALLLLGAAALLGAIALGRACRPTPRAPGAPDSAALPGAVLTGTGVTGTVLAGPVLAGPVLAGTVSTGRVRTGRALAASALAAALAALSWVALALPVVTLLAAAAGGAAPWALARSRRGRDAREAERAWSSALDQLADALEAGLAFPAALALVASAGPEPLRARFAGLHNHVRRGELEQGLDELAHAPERAAQTAVALLRAALVELPTGGLAPLLRELAHVGRERFESAERARDRALALRREATILAASPIFFLLLIGWSAPGYLAAYRSGGGTLVSLAGALAIGACYLAMLRLGRLPEPGRRP